MESQTQSDIPSQDNSALDPVLQHVAAGSETCVPSSTQGNGLEAPQESDSPPMAVSDDAYLPRSHADLARQNAIQINLHLLRIDQYFSDQYFDGPARSSHIYENSLFLHSLDERNNGRSYVANPPLLGTPTTNEIEQRHVAVVSAEIERTMAIFNRTTHVGMVLTPSPRIEPISDPPREPPPCLPPESVYQPTTSDPCHDQESAKDDSPTPTAEAPPMPTAAGPDTTPTADAPQTSAAASGIGLRPALGGQLVHSESPTWPSKPRPVSWEHKEDTFSQAKPGPSPAIDNEKSASAAFTRTYLQDMAADAPDPSSQEREGSSGSGSSSPPKKPRKEKSR